MKVYIVIDEEMGESDSVEYIFSTKEKAIEYCKATHKDQFLYERVVYEADVDSDSDFMDNAVEVYNQIKLPPSYIEEEKD